MDSQFTLIESAEIDPHQWNDFVLNHPQGHRMQTTLWADTKAHTGWNVRYLTVEQQGRLLGGAQLYERRLPLLGSLICLPKGPLSAPGQPQIADWLIKEVRQWACSSSKFCLLVQPPDQAGQLAQSLLQENFTKLAHENIVPPGTIIIDLSPEVEDLFKNLSRTKRGNLRRAQKSGIEVRKGCTEDLDIFYTLYKNTGCYLNFQPVHQEKFETIWQTLAPSGHAQLFISYFGDEPLSALLMLCFGKTATAWRFGWSGCHGEKRPNDALFWHAIQWAKEKGFSYFDFGEIELEAARCLCNGNTIPQEYLYTSIMFKMGFGGTPVLYPETYIYFTSAGMRWLYTKFLYKMLDLAPVQKLMTSAAG